MKTGIVLLVCVALVFSEEVRFDAIIEGDQQAPAVATVAEGAGTFKYNTESRKLSWDISYNFIQSGVSMAHIHGPAEMGENAGVLITLDIKEGETNGDTSGSQTLTIDQGEFLMNGLTYVNIHSEAEPNGEIRGQILTTSKYFHADVTGTQEAPTPVVDTPFEGYADISFDYESNEMKYEIHHDLDEATAVHIHGPARKGETADPIFVLDETDNSIKGKATLTEQQAIYLRSGLLYINIHSEAHPAGEIRGQILVDEDGSSAGDDDWWQVGLIVLAVVVGIAILSLIAVLIYKKKGDQIRSAMSSSRKSQEVRASLQSMNGGVSNEPLLADVKNI